MSELEDTVRVETVESTSRQSARCDDIILRETSMTRLIFQPQLVTNKHNPAACVNGKFVKQRKGPMSEWQETESYSAASLKAGQEVNLPLKSGELYNLLKGIEDLRAVHRLVGIPRRKMRVAVTDSSALDMLNALAAFDDPQKLIDVARKVNPADLDKIETTLSLARIEQAINEFSRALQKDQKEEWWQKKLTKWPWVLGQLFPQPIVLFAGKAYMGHKGIPNTGAELADFLFKNKLTGNVALIEIKTPQSLLLGRSYRQGYSIHSELTGAVGQVLSYRDTLLNEYYGLLKKSKEPFTAFNPKCVVVAGTADSIRNEEAKLRSFELYRTSLKDVEVITFDELVERCKGLVELMRPENEE